MAVPDAVAACEVLGEAAEDAVCVGVLLSEPVGGCVRLWLGDAACEAVCDAVPVGEGVDVSTNDVLCVGVGP